MAATDTPGDGLSRSASLIIAALVLIGSLSFALLVPRFGCREGMRLERDIPPPAGSPNGWICRRSDVGYVPHDDRLPLKLGVVVAGFIIAATLIRAARRRPTVSRGPVSREIWPSREDGGAGL